MGRLRLSLFSVGMMIMILSVTNRSFAKLLAEPGNMVPAIPAQTQPGICRLDLSDELFGGVRGACGGKVLDRSRCCPVLAAWLFAAHARSALRVDKPPPSPSAKSPEEEDSPPEDLMPMVPDDSQTCVNALQAALQRRSIFIPQPNATCESVMCFCGIRLHRIGSLSCPAAFEVSPANRTAAPMAAVRDLERNCKNASYAGCTRCLGALQKVVKVEHKKQSRGSDEAVDRRASEMFKRDCQLMGLTWLLARNKTAYIPTVSAVLRALMYSAHPRRSDSTCSPDQENMPLAVDSLELESAQSSAAAAALCRPFSLLLCLFPILPPIIQAIINSVTPSFLSPLFFLSF